MEQDNDDQFGPDMTFDYEWQDHNGEAYRFCQHSHSKIAFTEHDGQRYAIVPDGGDIQAPQLKAAECRAKVHFAAAHPLLGEAVSCPSVTMSYHGKGGSQVFMVHIVPVESLAPVEGQETL